MYYTAPLLKERLLHSQLHHTVAFFLNLTKIRGIFHRASPDYHQTQQKSIMIVNLRGNEIQLKVALDPPELIMPSILAFSDPRTMMSSL